MTIHIVDLELVVHTCPAQDAPHPYDIRRTIVDTIDGGPCRTPVLIRCGDTTTTIPCGRHAPPSGQCPTCRVIVTECSITTRTHDGTAG